MTKRHGCSVSRSRLLGSTFSNIHLRHEKGVNPSNNARSRTTQQKGATCRKLITGPDDSFRPNHCERLLYDSSTIPNIAGVAWAFEVTVMAYPIGLLFVGLIIRTVLGAFIVGGLVFLFWKLGRLADAYANKIKRK